MLDAIDALPQDEREALDLVRIHGMTHAEAAEILGVSTKTVQRRLNRAHLMLTTELDRPPANRAFRSRVLRVPGHKTCKEFPDRSLEALKPDRNELLRSG